MTIPPEHKEAHEVQLILWGEAMKAGPWIKFRVKPESYEWFKQFNKAGENQQRFYLVAVPIDDNEEPKPVEKKPFHELSRAQQAGILCGDPRFRAWLWRNFPDNQPCMNEAYPANYSAAGPSDIAAEMIRSICEVHTRADLDACSPKVWDHLVSRYREETQIPERRG